MSAEPIGPGRLILVVGPSGAGKDTLIDGVRARCAGDRGIVFPRRTVTRPSSEAEQHDHLGEAEFDRAATSGAFALWWRAHGLSYGIPSSVDGDICANRTVVCNVSRSVVPQARARFTRSEVVLVTAPSELLLARLTARARGTDGAVAERLRRNEGFAQFVADHTIENVGDSQAGIAALFEIVANEPKS